MTSLYIHFPWCVAKCPYCDFNSHENMGPHDEARYVDQLIVDLDSECNEDEPLTPFTSIFFGGGTPSLMSAGSVARILNAVDHHGLLAADTEVTLEANPGTAEQARFKGYREAGVNRMSLGIQSLQDNTLKAIGRIHDSSEAIDAVASAKAAGINNFNLDMMFGLPDQTINMALSDLKAAMALEPAHLSWYQLTLEPNTRFYSKPPSLPIADLIADMQDEGEKLLAQNGFQQYETSAYARQSKQCRHNLNYWQFGDYVGIGAGAHGKLTDSQGRITRTIKTRIPKDFLAHPRRKQSMVNEAELPLEFLMNALRLVDGFPRALFTQTTGLSIDVIADFLRSAAEKDLLDVTDEWVKPTRLGARHLNYLLTLA